MNKNKHEEEFIESLYDEANEELKEVYKEYKNNRDELLKELAMVILTYTVIDSVMRLSRKEKDKQYSKLSTLILKAVKGQGAVQEKVIREVLNNTIKNTFNFYSYNADLKDVKGIINKNFKGKHFSKRVWENENEVAKKLHSKVNNFLNGRINVNQIKKDIERTYNTSAYNAKRLVETEVNRCSSNAFDRFCIETGVKKVRYNATLDSKLCDDCGQYHDKVFDFDDKIEVPRHPLCRCFYTIEDYDKKSKVDDEVAVSNDEKDDIIKIDDARNFVQSDKQPKNIDIGNQNKHIVGTNEHKQYVEKFKRKNQYGPSRVTITNDEINELIRRYCGTGKVSVFKDGRIVETITKSDKIVGVVVNNLTGKEVETMVFRLHYSQKGVHLVPDYPSKRVKR